MQRTELINLIQSAETPEQAREVNKAVQDFMSSNPTNEDLQAVLAARFNAIESFLDEVDLGQQEALRYLALNGTKYNLTEWLTPTEYVKKYNLRGTNVVTNWMMRGVIPESDIIEVKELNGLRLIRDRVYKDTSVEVGG